MDYNNRQLAEIISQTSEKINSNVLKERKIANELEKTSKNIEENIILLKKQMEILNSTSIKPDLSYLNKFYEEKTSENIKRINSRLKVPNLALYVWLSSVLLFLCSGTFIYLSSQSKEDIIDSYQKELSEKGQTITPQKNTLVFEEMVEWFSKTPKAKAEFLNWQKSKTR